MLFQRYIQKIKELPIGELDKHHIQNSNFLLDEKNQMKIYYAPHNEYLNKKARVVIVGICPGWTQTKHAYKQAKRDLDNNVDIEHILKNCKITARFAGTMRKNLIDMLDELELSKKLGITSSSELFHCNDILHTTSLIPYPVFIDGKNYNGHTPAIIDSKFLMEYVNNHFFKEIKLMEEPPLIIPLGKSVEDVLRFMINKGLLNEEQCLFGFPHPSGANGHRKDFFNKNKFLLKEKINSFFINKC